MFESAASLWRRLTHRPTPVRPVAGPAVEEDRRVWVRRHVNVETRVTPAAGEGEASLPARILDVSSGGVKMTVGRPFEPGDLLTVELPARAGEPAVSVLACVAHAHPSEGAEWVVGCRFSAELSDADLAGFGVARARCALPDSRNWERFPCAVTAVYQVIADDESEEGRPAKVLNISPTGAALVVDDDIQAGALLSAELRAPTGGAVVTILACVVHVTVQSQHERILGCNFIQELSEDDLRALA